MSLNGRNPNENSKRSRPGPDIDANLFFSCLYLLPLLSLSLFVRVHISLVRVFKTILTTYLYHLSVTYCSTTLFPHAWPHTLPATRFYATQSQTVCVNSVAKTEESVEEKSELKKETIEKITVEEEETKSRNVEVEEVQPKKEEAEESGPEGNRTIVRETVEYRAERNAKE